MWNEKLINQSLVLFNLVYKRGANLLILGRLVLGEFTLKWLIYLVFVWSLNQNGPDLFPDGGGRRET